MDIQKIKIGNVEIEKTACLAPMASVADKAYRTLCKEFGASYVVSEMISSKGLFYNDKKTSKLCEVTDFEKPMALQLFGDDPEIMKLAVLKLEKYTPSIIDVNMGCPVPKIAGNGSGSALMKDPKLSSKIIRAMSDATSIPISVKIRSGWDFEHINAVEFAKMCEQSGASAICIHARTKTQMYSGKADWDIIRNVKKSVSIPVIGNGDVNSPLECARMYDETGCDLVMIGRATYGRPWIFKEINHYMKTGEILPPLDVKERLDIMLYHARLIIENKGEKMGMQEARKHVAWYIKGLPNAASYRNACGSLCTYEELEELASKALQSAMERI